MRPPLGIVLGAGFGLVIGTIVAAEMTVIGFASRYYRGRALSRTAVFALIPSLAGVHALLIGALSPDVGLLPADQLWPVATRQPVTAVSENLSFLGTFGTVTTLLGIYGHSQGERVVADVPTTDDSPSRNRPVLSAETVATAGEDGLVSIDVTCEWSPAAGTPSPSATCETIESREWVLPADLPLGELETRLAARITTAVGVDVQDISIDDRGRGIVTVGPPKETVATRLPDGKRAVTVRALVQAGLEADDRVSLVADGTAVDGRVLAVRAGKESTGSSLTCTGLHLKGRDRAAGRRDSPSRCCHVQPGYQTTDAFQVTVAVDAGAVNAVLTAETITFLVRSGSGNQPRGAFRQLERAGMIPLRVRIGEGNQNFLADHARDVEILARRRPEESGDNPDAWTFPSVGAFCRAEPPTDPPSRTAETESGPDHADSSGAEVDTETWIETLSTGTELFVLGPDRLVNRLREPDSRSGMWEGHDG